MGILGSSLSDESEPSMDSTYVGCGLFFSCGASCAKDGTSCSKPARRGGLIGVLLELTERSACKAD